MKRASLFNIEERKVCQFSVPLWGDFLLNFNKKFRSFEIVSFKIFNVSKTFETKRRESIEKKKNSTILTNSSLKINFEQKMENNHGKSGEKVYRNSSFGLIKQRI